MNMNPINPTDLRNILSTRTVQFAFKKLNGDLRTAVGTTCLSAIPVENHPIGDKKPVAIVNYFDLEKKEWRGISESAEIFLAE